MKKMILILLACFSTLLFPAVTFAYSNSEIISAVNSTRSQNSVRTLTENKQLNQAAAAKLADIQTYQYWAHDNPITQKTWYSFIREAGFKGASIGENLAKGYDSADSVVVAWLDSPSHRENLLYYKYNAIGVAIGDVNFSTGTQSVVVLTLGKTKANAALFLKNLLPQQKPIFALN